MSNTKLSVEIVDGQCDIYLNGVTNDLITALCAAIKGIGMNIIDGETYQQYLKNNEISKSDLQDCIYSMLLSKIVDGIEMFNEIDVDEVINDSKSDDIENSDNEQENSINTINQLDFSIFENLINTGDKK